MGQDWSVLTGFDQGISQISKQSDFNFDSRPCVWDFPLDIAFKSTNVYGWPSIILSVYGFDFLGRDVIRGYGSLVIPTIPGTYLLLTRYTLYVPLYAPQASTLFYQWYGWAMGRLPEFLDSKFPAKIQGREST